MGLRSAPGAGLCAPLRPGTLGAGKAALHARLNALAAVLSLAGLYALTLLLSGVSSDDAAASQQPSHAAGLLAETGMRVLARLGGPALDALAVFAALLAGLPVLALRRRKASRCSAAAAPAPALLLALLLAGLTKPVDGACTGNGTIACGDSLCCNADTEICQINHGSPSCVGKHEQKLMLLILIVVFPLGLCAVARVVWVKEKARRQAQLEFEQQHQQAPQGQAPHDGAEAAHQEKQEQAAAGVEHTTAEKAVTVVALADLPAPTQQPRVLPRDLFTPRADEMLLALFRDEATCKDRDVPASAAEAAQDGAWLSRMCVAEEDALLQRPAGWSSEHHCPDHDEPKAVVPFNVGFPDAAPQFGTVDAAAWRALCAALFSGCDALSDKLFVDGCGLRLYDVRRGAAYALGRLFWRVRRLSTPQKCAVYPLLFVCVAIPCVPSMYLAMLTMLLELLLFILLAMLFCSSPFGGQPLPGVGAEARNAAHIARRTAVLDDFAKAHNLVITYECVHFIGWGDPAAPPKQRKTWCARRQPALRVRKATPDGPPAGLLLGDSAKV